MNGYEEKMIKNTPWGPPEQETIFQEGVTFVHTASHGGFFLDEERNKKIPSYARKDSGWYEEDCEWAIVGVVFEISFDSAKNTLRNWDPYSYEKYFQTTIKPGESYARDQEIFRTKHFNDFVVYSAMSNSNPPDTAKCFARRESDGAEIEVIVPLDEYQKRGRFGYVVPEQGEKK